MHTTSSPRQLSRALPLSRLTRSHFDIIVPRLNAIPEQIKVDSIVSENSTSTVDLDALASLAKQRGFIFQSSEIYGGISSTWDYGPLGVELKRNIKDAWWRTFVWERDDMVGLDSSILMNPEVWRASGHVDSFTDPLVDCRVCRQRWREDQLEERKCPAIAAANSPRRATST